MLLQTAAAGFPGQGALSRQSILWMLLVPQPQSEQDHDQVGLLGITFIQIE